MDTHTFFRDIGRRFGCDDGRADALTFVVFQELRDRLTPKEAADVSAQLPSALKRMWREGEHPNRAVHRTHAPELLARVRSRLVLPSEAEAKRAVQVVFRTLQQLLGSATGKEGEAWDVFSQLPKDLKQLWLESSRLS